MMDFRSISVSVYVAVVAFATATGAAAATDPTQYLPSTLPGYAKTQEKCLRCHTAEPMSYQPENAPRAYWESEVKRMKRIFKVKIDDAEMADIVDYMTKTYGNEKDGAVVAPKDTQKDAVQNVPAATAPQVVATQTPAAVVPAVKPEVVTEPAPVSQSIFPTRRR